MDRPWEHIAAAESPGMVDKPELLRWDRSCNKLAERIQLHHMRLAGPNSR